MASNFDDWLIITVPPDVLYCDALLLAGLQHKAQISSDKSKDLHAQNCDYSQNRVNIEVRRTLILRQRRKSHHNSTVHCPISTKILSHEQSPGLNKSIIVCSDSTTHWSAWKLSYCNSTVHCPIGPKLLRLNQSPDLNTSLSLYVVIVIAPHTVNRK